MNGLLSAQCRIGAKILCVFDRVSPVRVGPFGLLRLPNRSRPSAPGKDHLHGDPRQCGEHLTHAGWCCTVMRILRNTVTYNRSTTRNPFGPTFPVDLRSSPQYDGRLTQARGRLRSPMMRAVISRLANAPRSLLGSKSHAHSSLTTKYGRAAALWHPGMRAAAFPDDSCQCRRSASSTVSGPS